MRLFWDIANELVFRLSSWSCSPRREMWSLRELSFTSDLWQNCVQDPIWSVLNSQY